MSTNTQTQHDVSTLAADQLLLTAIVDAVRAAGAVLLERFSTPVARTSGQELMSAVRANDDASAAVLRGVLTQARPSAKWVADEFEGGVLPAGEWWITDPAEGNINHVHGLPEWGVTATLVRDNLPVLTAVFLPLSKQTYTAVRGGGAFLNGVALHPSAKSELRAAIVATSQARPNESHETNLRLGQSIITMMDAALVVRLSVPASLHLMLVASGQIDAFWQLSQVRADLVSGALLVKEAGGTVTDLHGQPWEVGSEHFLASAPGLHQAAIEALAGVSSPTVTSSLGQTS